MKPTNTSKDLMIHLANAMVMGSSQSIEYMEKCGQQELVASDVLPTNGLEKCRQILESAGGKIGLPVKGDEIFTEVTLPPGWKKTGTSHSMWSDLIDDKGRRRAGIFYKAAFYDRSAHISPDCRFRIDSYSHTTAHPGETCVVLVDTCGQVSFASEVSKDDYYSAREALRKQVEAFLNEKFPDWQNPAAYWE